MPVKSHHKLVLMLGISVLIHVLLFSLLYLGKQTKQVPLSSNEPEPISASLYYYEPPEVQKVETTRPAELEEPLPEEEPVEQIPPTDIAEPELVEILPAQPEQTEAEIEPLSAEKPSINKLQPADPTSNNPYAQPMQDVVKGQLHIYQQGKLDKLATQAATEYRRQLNSPVLLSKPQNSFISEDEKYLQKVTTNVDCSSATNQTMAIVMGIMGGAVKCSEPPPFDSFIQKRLNKTAELPAMQP